MNAAFLLAVLRRFAQSHRPRYRKEMQRLLDQVWDEEEMHKQLQRIHGMTEDHLTLRKATVKHHSKRIDDFLKNRRAEVQAELNAPAMSWPNVERPGPPPTDVPLMDVKGTFATVFTAKPPAEPLSAGDASLEVSVQGEKKKYFTRFGAVAALENEHFIVPRPDYPMLWLYASDASGERTWILSFLIDPVRLESGNVVLPVDHFAVWAQLVEGDPFAPMPKGQPFGIRARLKLNATKREIGGALSGEFEIQAIAL